MIFVRLVETARMHCSLRKCVLCLTVFICVIVAYRVLFQAGDVDFNLKVGEPDSGQVSGGISCLLNGSCYTQHRSTGRRAGGLEASGPDFKLNGEKFRIISGSFHYFRTHPEQWEDRLKRMKAAGLNTVMTYVPWNLVERVRGTVSVARGSTMWDLIRFIELVHTAGLYLIIRPGPYICAEWELGGFPSWLLHDPHMTVRSSKYAPFLNHVSKYFDHLLPVIAERTYVQGGPIIAIQIENEFGSYSYDLNYLKFIEGLFDKYKIDALMFTSDGPDRLSNGTVPDVLATINLNRNITEAIQTLREFQPGRPAMITEFWNGWFDHWNNSHATMRVERFTKLVDAVLALGASINFYMFVGGTNFGFYNGANHDVIHNKNYSPTITSYDYDGLISESGDCHPTKYEALRSLLVKHNIVKPDSLPPIPSNPERATYTATEVQNYMPLNDMTKLTLPKPVRLAETIFMEFLNINNNGGQAFGWLLYRATVGKFSASSELIIKGLLLNRGQIFINNQLVTTIYNVKSKPAEVTLSLADIKPSADDANTLELLVENLGRVNYMLLDDQRRGFVGQISLDGTVINDWTHISLEFQDDFIESLSKSKDWKSLPVVDKSYPAAYRVSFDLSTDELYDTFLDMIGWTKGIVLLNGFNLGRYWHLGPQRTLYVPAPLLRPGHNELIIFELEKPSNRIEFSSVAMLDEKWIS